MEDTIYSNPTNTTRAQSEIVDRDIMEVHEVIDFI